MKNQIVPYESRAASMNKKAAQKEISEIIKTYKEVDADVAQMKTVSIKAANGCRKIGIQLQTLCGHEQISFEFWQKNCGALSKQFDFGHAKIFIAVARKMEKPAKTIEEAAPFTQLIYQAVNLLELPERGEQQISNPTGPMQKFFFVVTSIRKDFEKATRQVPMENWGPNMLRSFVKDGEWFAEAYAKAKGFLEAKK